MVTYVKLNKIRVKIVYIKEHLQTDAHYLCLGGAGGWVACRHIVSLRANHTGA